MSGLPRLNSKLSMERSQPMEVLTLDEFGRIQIPPHVISQLGLNQNTRLSLEIENERLVLKALSSEPELEYENGVLVVRSFPTGNLDTILNEVREERIADLTKW